MTVDIDLALLLVAAILAEMRWKLGKFSERLESVEKKIDEHLKEAA